MFDSDADSAFGSGDPTPSHKPRYAIEFSEDPFQNEVHRYGDPFDISGTSLIIVNIGDPNCSERPLRSSVVC